MRQNLYKSILTLVLFLFFSAAFAQVGTIKGVIKDEKNGEAIIGGNIVIEGTSIGAATDVEGNYTIPKVKAGKYNLVVTYISYVTKTIPNIEVYPDQTTIVNTAIKEEATELQAVTVSAGRVTDTDVSVVTELKKADLIAVGISSQQIKLSQDRDAAQVIRRVPGVTIIGNRFINVRGLSERYSTVMLNGIIAPSSEVDSKAFSFDLIPSNMLDRMLVYKSGSPELPGEFAGAVVSIFTKSVVDENSMSISLSGSLRNATTGADVKLSQEKGSKDWLGSDDGTRALPAAFPTVNLRSLSLSNSTEQATLINATKLLPNTWGTRSLNASPDFRMNFDIARTINIGERSKLQNITSLSYAETNQKLELSQNYYDNFSTTLQKSTPRYRYNDVRFTKTNRLGIVSNFTFQINPSNRIEFRNFYNQQGQNQSTIRTGTEDAVGYDVNNLALNYFGRSIYSGQLSGKHSFTDAVSFNWIFGYNNTTANQPDYRRIRSQRSQGTTDPFVAVIPPGASSFDAGRFYSKLKEDVLSAAGNLEIKLNTAQEENKQAKIITGYYLEQKERNFDARWMAYKWLNTNAIDNSLLLKPFDQLFVPANLGTKFILEEGTNDGPDQFDKYDGSSTLLAGYAGIVTPFADKFRLSAGLRIENNVQKIDVYSIGLKQQVVNNSLTVPMPFFNLSYNLKKEMYLRLAYSKTVNRPVFRELAPFNFYDFESNSNLFGNKDLISAKIDNIDFSWELYPTPAEKISIGIFYKNFIDPIEKYLVPGSNPIYSFINATKATNYGIEAEVRKSLQNLSSSLLNKITLVFNGALISSSIELPQKRGDRDLSTLESNRALQGQSPYVFNAGAYYNHPDKGFQMSLQYNVFGKRIFAVGDKDANPNQYEMPRNQVDLTITKEINQHFELRFGIQDIINQQYRLIQDSNRDKEITDVDEVIQAYKFGQYTTLGVIWKL